MACPFAWFGGALVIAVCAAVGCGGAVETSVSVDRGSGGADVGAPPAETSADAGNEEPVEPSSRGVCGLESGATSTKCRVLRDRCPAERCGAAVNAFVYSCMKDDGGKRPPVDGCALYSTGPNHDVWCCPPACVPSPSEARTCPPGFQPWSCARDRVKGTLLAQPAAGCYPTPGPGGEGGFFCCP